MPSIRVGFGTDLNITGGLTGIGTTNPAVQLDIPGQIRSENTAGSGGVSTFREYQGFSQVEAKITNNVTIDNESGGPYSSLSGEIKITGETTVSSGSTVEVGKTKTLTVTDRFAAPLGETNNRDTAPEAGTTRFNQDFGTLEFFDGVNWKTVNSYNRGDAAGRGVYGGGQHPGATDRMGYIQIQSLGNSEYFGKLPRGDCENVAGCSSDIRGLIGGGGNQIEYFTIASTGDAVDFGDLTQSRSILDALSSSTRGIFAGGFVSPAGVNTMDYIEISTTGNALDFGDISYSGVNGNTCLSSPTRGIIAGGRTPTTKFTDIEFITISSKGNSIQFGELGSAVSERAAASNGVRGVFMGGESFNGADTLSQCDYITISSSGNALTFGDLNVVSRICRSVCDRQRVVKLGGKNDSVDPHNVMEYITFSTLGNAIDFGDTDIAVKSMGACSDSHGGLGGF
jgi:hypothetical protein